MEKEVSGQPDCRAGRNPDYLEQKNASSVDDANIGSQPKAGMATEQGIAMVQELAEVLGGAMGVSRKVAGLVPMNTRVGQTGKTGGLSCISPVVSPAQCSMWVGMSSSRTIIAINLTPDAQIFHVADIGGGGGRLRVPSPS